MPKYISGRYKKVPLSQLREDRYRYLSPGEAEPSLGDPLVGPSSIGAKPVAAGQQYIMVSVQGQPGERYWIPNQGGIIPGSISVFDEDFLVGGLSKTTQLNIVGVAVTAEQPAGEFVGVPVTTTGNIAIGTDTITGITTTDIELGYIVVNEFVSAGSTVTSLGTNTVGISQTTTNSSPETGISFTFNPEYNPKVDIRVFSPGNDSEVLFNTSGDFSTDSTFTFDSTENLLAAGDRITVGTGGTVITTLGIGSVGIGTTNPVSRLHVEGDLKLSGTIIDRLGNTGDVGYLLVKEEDVFGGVKWTNPNAVRSGAGGTYGQIQFHGSTQLVEGAANFYYDEGNQRVGIGSTQPTQLLDVLGISTFSGGVFIDNLTVSGFSTFKEKVTVEKDIDVDGHTELDNLNVSGVSTFKEKITVKKDIDVDGHTEVDDFQASGISTFINTQNNILGNVNTGAVQVDGGVGIAKNLTVGAGISAPYLYITGVATIAQFDFGIGEFENIKVTGVSTLGNVEISNNEVTTTEGNLTLKADSTATVQVDTNNKFVINSTQDSASKDTGALIVQGGVGIEKNLYVGGNTNLGDVATDKVSFAASVSSNIIPSGMRDLGSASHPWNYVYANIFSGYIESANYANNAGLATDVKINGTNQLLYQSGNNATDVLPVGNPGQILKSNGSSSAPSWISVGNISVGIAETANNLAGGAAGSIPYQDGPGSTVFLTEPDGDGYVLTYNDESDALQWSQLTTLPGAGYTFFAVDSGNNVILRLSDGSTNDDVTITAGSGISIDPVTEGGFTISGSGGGFDFSGLEVYEESASIGTDFTALKFIGNSITATDGGNGIANVSIAVTYGDVTDAPTDISDLTDTDGTIPTDIGDLTNNVGFITSGSLDGYATEGYVDSAVAEVSTFSGDYNDLSNKPTIPTDISNLTDNNGTIATAATNAGFITGITVKDENGGVVGLAGSITELDFNGSSGVTIVANSGIASILISGGSGGGDVAVEQDNYNCTNPITTNGSTITIGSLSNAYGTRYVEDHLPLPSDGCDGDLWYYTAGDVSSNIVLATPQTATGTEVEFTGIPSWAKRITIMFNGLTRSDDDNYLILLGTSSGYITSGYNSLSQSEGGANEESSTTSFEIYGGGSSGVRNGRLQLDKFSDSAYVLVGQLSSGVGGGTQAYASLNGISGNVDRLKINLSGTDTFTGGSFNISYE